MRSLLNFFFLFVLLYLVIGNPILYANEASYQQHFKNGIEFYESKQYKRADASLRKSFELKKHSKTAYFIADSNFELGDHATAKTYANLALYDLKPSLESDKKEYLKNMVSEIDDRAVMDYKRVKSTIRYSLTLSKNELRSKDLVKLKAIEENSKRRIQRAREKLIALGIDPDEIDNSVLMLIPDKCDPNYAGDRTPGER